MADPRPPRPGMGALADDLRSIRSELRQLNSPSGTQRGGVTSNLSRTVEAIAAKTTRAADQGSAWSATIPGDGVERVFATGTTVRVVSTGSALVEVSTGHGRMSLFGSGSAAISLRMTVRDPATGAVITGGSAGASARLAASFTTGSSMGFATLAAIRPGLVEIGTVVMVSCTVQTAFAIDAPSLTVRPQ